MTPEKNDAFYINSYPKRQFKTNEDWHLFWVSQDPEFQQDMDAAIPYLLSLQMLDKRGRVTKQYKQKESQIYKELSEKYLIETYQIEYLGTGAFDKLLLDSETPTWHYHKNKSYYTVEIWPETTKNMFLRAWDEIRADILERGFGIPRGRKRSSGKSQLLYAIFKARKNGTTFPKIFKLYKAGTLPLYKNKPSTAFDTSKELADYYYLFGPENFPLE